MSKKKHARRELKIFSYVVDHDHGREPNPYFGVCTLCRCKYSQIAEATEGRKGNKNIVELAEEGDWIIGTGGASNKSAGHGKLIYVMQVEERPNRWEYFTRFPQKNPERPINDFQKTRQFALVSRHFYYFGKNAIDIPQRFEHFQKKGPHFLYVKPGEFNSFREWLETEYKPGQHGEPCSPLPQAPKCPSKAKAVEKPQTGRQCKSSC